MATIGRAKAICIIAGLKFTGFFAWMLWCLIHIFFLISFRNKFKVMAEWAWYYLTFRHGIRLITGHPVEK
jgi:NADH dehydrogenase